MASGTRVAQARATVACPYCGAPAGEKCMTETFTMTIGIHLSRLAAAEEAGK